MLDQNYIITVTEANTFLRPKGELPDPSDRGVIKDETGQLSGSVGLNDRWWVEEAESPYASYPDNQLPRYQDIIPRPYSCGDGEYFFRYNGTDFHVYPQVPIRDTSSQYVMFYWQADDRPNRFDIYENLNLVFSTGWVGYANYAGPWGSSLAVNPNGSQYIAFAGFTGRYIQAQAGPADPNNPVNDKYTINMTCQEATTTTTTTTAAPVTVTLSPQNSPATNDYAIYINGVADSSFKSGSKTYAPGTTIKIIYTSGVCGVTRNGSAYASDTTFTGVSGTTYTFVLNNANSWTASGGGVCTGCVSYINEVNPCGVPRATTPGGSYCNSIANYNTEVGQYHTCSGGNVYSYTVYQNSNGCFTADTQWLMNGDGYTYNPANSYPNTSPTWEANNSYTCYGGCNKYMRYIDTNPCSSSWNNPKPQNNADIVEFDSTFCGGCCGQSRNPNWVPSGSYDCYGTCDKYNVNVDNNRVCSGTPVGATQQGSLVAYNNAFCGACCGQSTAANWVNNGEAFCGSGSCIRYQPQIDNNPCSSTYGDTDNVNLGSNSLCGSWDWVYYCVNYGVAPYERRRYELNYCTNATRNDELVAYDSADCGWYPALGSFGISVNGGDSSFACTRVVNNTAYCSGGDPYVGNTIHTTDNPASSTYGAGVYHIDGDQWIEINGSGVVVDRGYC